MFKNFISTQDNSLLPPRKRPRIMPPGINTPAEAERAAMSPTTTWVGTTVQPGNNNKKRTWNEFTEDSVSIIAKGPDDGESHEKETFLATKSDLKHHSPVLRACLSGPWKEAVENEISMFFHPRHVEAMLTYMTTFDYHHDGVPASSDPTKRNPGARPLTFHAEMFRLADYYDITGLQELAVEKFSRAVRNMFDVGCYTRNDTAVAVEDFCAAARIAYDATPETASRALRSVMDLDEYAYLVNLATDHM